MNKTQGLLIKILVVANVLVYAGAGWLLWYIWPVLIEPPAEASASRYMVPVSAPTQTPAVNLSITEQSFLTPSLRLTPKYVTRTASEPLEPPISTPIPAPTPQILLWPSNDPEGLEGNSGRGLSAPNPSPIVDLSPQQVNILFMGADYRKGQGHWRTDSIIVVTVDPVKGSIRLLSIPRDLWVHIPGYGSERINTADFLGERLGVNDDRANLIRQTIEQNLGIPIHYYVRLNYSGFEKILNTLGGVTVQVDCPLQETFRDSRSPTGWSYFAIEPGIHHMDSWTALIYARLRKTTSDFDRSRRQQAIMKGIWQGALAADVIRDGPRLYTILKDSVETDLNLQNMLALGYVAVRIGPSSIRSHYIDRSAVRSWTTPGGASVLLPEQARVAEVVEDMFSAEKVVEKVAQERAKVRILDGVGDADRADLLASQMRWQGLKVVRVEPADRADYAQSVIIDYGTYEKQQSLSRLCDMLGIKPELVNKERAPNSSVDFLVILGGDYDPCRMR
jgi:LCP family protein required for cell wall assembly